MQEKIKCIFNVSSGNSTWQSFHTLYYSEMSEMLQALWPQWVRSYQSFLQLQGGGVDFCWSPPPGGRLLTPVLILFLGVFWGHFACSGKEEMEKLYSTDQNPLCRWRCSSGSKSNLDTISIWYSVWIVSGGCSSKTTFKPRGTSKTNTFFQGWRQTLLVGLQELMDLHSICNWWNEGWLTKA